MNTREYADAEDAADEQRRKLRRDRKRADAAAKRGTAAIMKEALRAAQSFVNRGEMPDG